MKAPRAPDFLAEDLARSAAELHCTREEAASARYGLYQITECLGQDVTLAPCTGREELRATAFPSAPWLRGDAWIAGWVIPARGGLHLSLGAREAPPAAGALAREMVGEEGYTRLFLDPQSLGRALLQEDLQRYPAASRFEARLRAAIQLAHAGVRHTIPQIEEILQEEESAVKFLEELRLEEHLDSKDLSLAVCELWNWTPRRNLGGKCPMEHDGDDGDEKTSNAENRDHTHEHGEPGDCQGHDHGHQHHEGCQGHHHDHHHGHEHPHRHDAPSGSATATGQAHSHSHGHSHSHSHSHSHAQRTPITRDAPRVGRNDPCACGSGKKHKKCCGKAE